MTSKILAYKPAEKATDRIKKPKIAQNFATDMLPISLRGDLL